MAFNPNIPQANDLLSDSQGDILVNFQTSNTSFGIDHYAFSNLTANNGKHNKVTTPIISGGVAPVTASNEPIMYALNPNGSIQALHFSRGGNNAVPTPLTYLQSTNAAISLLPLASTTIVSLTGVAIASGIVSGYNAAAGANSYVIARFSWTNATNLMVINTISASGANTMAVTAPVLGQLSLQNTSGITYNDVYWTLQFFRCT